METPIINPLYFYFIDIFETINDYLSFLQFVFLISIVIFILVYVFSITENSFFAKRFSYRGFIISLILFFFVSLINIFIPSRDTLYKMMIANFITYEKVDKTIKFGKDFEEKLKKDIIDIINSIKEEDNENK